MKSTHTPENFIAPLDMNGLQGRMLHLPNARHKDTEILFIYGQHSSLERWWGLLQYLNHFGAVTAPDLPGLGGMESFYKIDKQPTIDNFADYLASFMKMRYRRKKVIIVGLSFGFVVVTRMLQRYPELTKKVVLLVSLVGFTHADDFSFSRSRRLYYKGLTTLLSHRLPAFLFRRIGLNRFVLRAVYRHTDLTEPKFNNNATNQNYRLLMEVEIWLWQHNDIRTQAYTTGEFMRLDNCQKQIDLQLWHVVTDADQYFDHHRVDQHLRVIFSDVNIARAKFNNHAPSVIANEREVMVLIPPELRRVMRQL